MTIRSISPVDADLQEQFRDFFRRRVAETIGCALLVGVLALAVALVSWSVQDPSVNHAAAGRIRNLLGAPGAVAADIVMQLIGLASITLLAAPAFWGFRLVAHHAIRRCHDDAFEAVDVVRKGAQIGLTLANPADGLWHRGWRRSAADRGP